MRSTWLSQGDFFAERIIIAML